METPGQREAELKFAVGRPRYLHPWENIEVGWRGTVNQVSERLGISTKQLYNMIYGEKGYSLPRGFEARREGYRYYIERTADVPFRDLLQPAGRPSHA